MTYAWLKDISRWRGMLRLFKSENKPRYVFKLQRMMRRNRGQLFNVPHTGNCGRQVRHNRFIMERRAKFK